MKNGVFSSSSLNNNKEDVNLTKIKELELELAQTKLALVEAECRNQVKMIIIAFRFLKQFLISEKLTTILLFGKNV